MSALVDLSATEIREKIAAGQVSAVEYVTACLARVDQLNETLNAIVTLNHTRWTTPGRWIGASSPEMPPGRSAG